MVALKSSSLIPMTARACTLDGVGHHCHCQDAPEGNHYEDEGGSYPWTAAGRPSRQVTIDESCNPVTGGWMIIRVQELAGVYFLCPNRGHTFVNCPRLKPGVPQNEAEHMGYGACLGWSKSNAYYLIVRQNQPLKVKKSTQKHKWPNKHHHHGDEAAHPSSGMDLMNPCRLMGGRPCTYIVQGRC